MLFFPVRREILTANAGTGAAGAPSDANEWRIPLVKYLVRVRCPASSRLISMVLYYFWCRSLNVTSAAIKRGVISSV